MTIALKPEHLKAIREHGRADYPNECCGLLIGKFGADGGKVVEEVYRISNAQEAAARRNRFSIAPIELLHGEKYARSKKRDIVGFYHSHPDHPAEPSAFDLEHAWPIYSYVIVAVKENRAGAVLSWELRADGSRFEPEKLVGE